MHVLLVEDEWVAAAIMKKKLHCLGAQCTIARSGDEALECLERDRVDVLITDLDHPGVTAEALVSVIREPHRPYTYCLVSSSTHAQERGLELVHGGADGYLTKPINLLELEMRIVSARRILRLHAAIREHAHGLEDLNRELFEQGRTDALTGLRNRRCLEEALSKAGHLGATLMIDIDHFKGYNDHYGHREGDQCLRQVATAIRDSLRANDRAYRYGGEEFAVLLTTCSARQAEEIAERIVVAVRSLNIPHKRSPEGVVTVSVGVAPLHAQSNSASESLLAADAALYHAKSSGRDRVATANDARTSPPCPEMEPQ